MSQDLPPFDVYRGDGKTTESPRHLLHEGKFLLEEQGVYLADPELAEAVNVALCVGQPLLVTGEPGCGKTRLAWSVARELDLGEPLLFFTRSTARAQDLLYTYDAVRRFYDIQAHDAAAAEAANYIRYQALGKAIVDGVRRVVLVDEIDKAPRDFPNDLLNELDRMSFEVKELTGDRIKSTDVQPIVVITSNSERQLPLPFLRRCVFHHIAFPDSRKLRLILRERLRGRGLDPDLMRSAVDRFREVREIGDLTKRPGTGELLTWTLALHAKGITATLLRGVQLRELPLWQALLKDTDDYGRLRAAT